MGLVALRHVGSSQTRARTRVPCIGKRVLNHCATGEALYNSFKIYIDILDIMKSLWPLFWSLENIVSERYGGGTTNLYVPFQVKEV